VQNMASKCAMCEVDIEASSLVRCCKCTNDYHFFCTSIRLAQWKNYTPEQKNRHSFTNCKQPPAKIEELIEQLKKDLISEFQNKIEQLRNDFAQRIQELEKGVQFLNDEVEEYKGHTAELQSKNKALEKCN